mgnify:CR=1 FL=1
MEIGKILSLPLTIAVREKISPDFQFQLLLLFISIITDKKDTFDYRYSYWRYFFLNNLL